jgi:hypothetical protein
MIVGVYTAINGDSNAGSIIGDDAVLVIDSFIDPPGQSSAERNPQDHAKACSLFGEYALPRGPRLG